MTECWQKPKVWVKGVFWHFIFFLTTICVRVWIALRRNNFFAYCRLDRFLVLVSQGSTLAVINCWSKIHIFEIVHFCWEHHLLRGYSCSDQYASYIDERQTFVKYINLRTFNKVWCAINYFLSNTEPKYKLCINSKQYVIIHTMGTGKDSEFVSIFIFIQTNGTYIIFISYDRNNKIN